MTTKMTETATLAAIGAAARELHLPAVRTEAPRLAEEAKRSQNTDTSASSPRYSPPRWTNAQNDVASGGCERPTSRA